MKIVKNVVLILLFFLCACSFNKDTSNKELNIISNPPLEVPPNFYIKAPVEGNDDFLKKSQKFNSEGVKKSVFGEEEVNIQDSEEEILLIENNKDFVNDESDEIFIQEISDNEMIKNSKQNSKQSVKKSGNKKCKK